MNNKDRLEEIWNHFEGKFINNSEIKTIFDYGYVHSDVDASEKVLFTGINPSYNGNPNDPEPYDVHKAVENYGKYYKKFQTIATYCDLKSNWTYLDLFYFRATKQNSLNLFLKDKKGLEFLCEQLVLTQEILEKIKPKLIVVCNKRSHDFWGKNIINNNVTPVSNVWMGYDFAPAKINGFEINDDLKIINGLVQSDGRVAEKITKTNLKGTLVYFLNFIQYTKKEDKLKIYENIKKIIQSGEFGK